MRKGHQGGPYSGNGRAAIVEGVGRLCSLAFSYRVSADTFSRVGGGLTRGSYGSSAPTASPAGVPSDAWGAWGDAARGASASLDVIVSDVAQTDDGKSAG